MKNLHILQNHLRVVLCASLLALATLFVGDTAKASKPDTNALNASVAPATIPSTCGTTSWNLTAGQTMDVGTVTVSNDATNVYVKYALDDPDYPNACFGTLHLWVGNDLFLVPSNPKGTPVPGQFPYHHSATGLKEYTFAIPFADLNILNVNDACGKSLVVVTHAEVDLDCGDADTGHETAFGGPISGAGPRWWFYGGYTVCCDFGTPPVPVCDTAYAKGGYVWTTDKKSNPENLPSLNLTRNRWGWAIKLTAPGITTYDIWAGAGLNNTANGYKVGTATVNWDGATASVSYSLITGYYLGEVHLWARDAAPNTIAPGQYGYLDYFDPRRSNYKFTVPLADANGDGCAWIVAHAVVCNTM